MSDVASPGFSAFTSTPVPHKRRTSACTKSNIASFELVNAVIHSYGRVLKSRSLRQRSERANAKLEKSTIQPRAAASWSISNSVTRACPT